MKQLVTGGLKIVGTIVGVVFLAWFLNQYVITRVTVLGDSMEPVLSDKERIWIAPKKSPFITDEFARYEIVVFSYRYREEQYYMKRVIGLPGETVQIMDGFVYINGQRLEEDYGLEPIEDPKRAKEPIVLGEDEYFVLGDNRNHSTDSRDSDVANVTYEQIIGKVFSWQEN